MTSSSSEFLISKVENLKKLLREHKYYEHFFCQLSFLERVPLSCMMSCPMSAPEILRQFEQVWNERLQEPGNPMFIKIKEDDYKVIYNNIKREELLNRVYEKYFLDVWETESEEEVKAELFNLSCRCLGYINLLLYYSEENKK